MTPPGSAPLAKGHFQDDPGNTFRKLGVHPEIDLETRHRKLPKFGDPKVKKFSYERLSNMHKRIRLLTLNSGAEETNEVECRLFEGEISQGQVLRVENGVALEVVSYEALSWSWGTREHRYQVLIRKDDERYEKMASPDLVWALRFLRHPNRDRVLWIDALCIDQGNVEEKNHQVQMMSQIYSYASSVCVWLGLDDLSTRMAIKFIREEILKLEQFDDLCQDPANSQKWRSLLLLMQKPWFFRRWVVQEIALAKQATIYCGPDQIDWKDFSVAVELFVEVETATHRLSEVMKKDPNFYHVPGWFEYVSALGASLLVEATGMIFRYYKPKAAPKGLSTIKEATGSDIRKQRAESSGESDSGAESVEQQYDIHEIPPESEDEEPEQHQDTPEDKAGSSGSAGKSTQVAPAGTPRTPGTTGTPGTGNPQTSTSAKWPDTPEDPISQRRPLLSLEYLVSRLSIFEATEPRDAIYALLAIANDGYPAAEGSGDDTLSSMHAYLGSPAGQQRQKAFPVDYGRSYADVCQNFIEFCIKKPNEDSRVGSWTRERTDRTRAMDIMCRPWAPEPKPGLSIRFNRPAGQSDRRNSGVGEYWREHLKKIRSIRQDAWKDHKKKASEAGGKHRAKDEFFNPPWKKYFPKKDQQSNHKAEDDEEVAKLPSWIPRLAGAPFAMHNQAGVHIMKMGRKNADPLVGFPNSVRNYDAAQGNEVDMDTLEFRKNRRFGTHSMFIKGFILEEVKSTTHPSQGGNIPQEWLNMAGWKIKDFSDPDGDSGPPDEFWRTLVADRGRDSRNPPYYYKKACKESIYKGGLQSGSVNTSDLINNERNSIVAQFCRRVQAVIWNRLMVKTDHGNLGITAKGVRTKDLVCILYGCSVPVILREREKSPEEQGEDSGEEEMMRDVEEVMRRGMATMQSNRRRKTAYKSIPDHPQPDWERKPDRNRTGTGEARPEQENWVGPDGRPRWTKKQVKGWQQDYNRKTESEEPGNHNQNSQNLQGIGHGHATTRRRASKSRNARSNNKTDDLWKPRVPRDVYYEFLGECYIHGMMDGEAMSRKADSEEAEIERRNQFALFRKEQKKQTPVGEAEDPKKKQRESKVPEELKKVAREVQSVIAERRKHHQERKDKYVARLQEWEELEKEMEPRVGPVKRTSPRPIANRRNTWSSALAGRRLSREPTLRAPDRSGLGIQSVLEENDGDGDGGGGSGRSNSYTASVKSPEPIQQGHFNSIDGMQKELPGRARKAPEWLRKRAEANPDKQAEADGWDYFRDKVRCDTIFELR
ncbi:hypothetical protein RB595_008368 [Gaeumannomyces hyphopodioides]